MKAAIECLVGRFDYWRHNDLLENGELAVGNCQAVILAELDSPRSPSVKIQLLGLQ
jgi:hypothetical protein